MKPGERAVILACAYFVAACVHTLAGMVIDQWAAFWSLVALCASGTGLALWFVLIALRGTPTGRRPR